MFLERTKGKIYLVLELIESIHPSLKERSFVLSDSLIDTETCIPQVIKYINIIPPEWAITESDSVASFV